MRHNARHLATLFSAYIGTIDALEKLNTTDFFNRMNTAVHIIDVDTHRLIDANRAACELFGETREAAQGSYVPDMSAEPDVTRATINAHRCGVSLRWVRHRAVLGSGRRRK